jgi:hypothetical protein
MWCNVARCVAHTVPVFGFDLNVELCILGKEDVMQKKASVAKFDVVCDQSHIDWVRSSEGHKALKEAQEEARKFIRKREKERAITREMLEEPFTI